MRFFTCLVAALLASSPALGQPKSADLIADFRHKIGADIGSAMSIPYMIDYRGERYSYTPSGGRITGEAFPFRAKLYGFTDKHHKHRKELEFKIGIVPLKIVEVIDGNTGFYQFNEGELVPMSKAELDGRDKRELHAEVFLGRESFAPKTWQFTDPRSTEVRGEGAWKIEGKASGHEPMTLYFNKQTGLLSRLTTKTTDFVWNPVEKARLETFTRDLYLSDWKQFGKRMLPGRLEAYHDGVLWQQMEPLNVSMLDKADPKLFAGPAPVK